MIRRRGCSGLHHIAVSTRLPPSRASSIAGTRSLSADTTTATSHGRCLRAGLGRGDQQNASRRVVGPKTNTPRHSRRTGKAGRTMPKLARFTGCATHSGGSFSDPSPSLRLGGPSCSVGAAGSGRKLDLNGKQTLILFDDEVNLAIITPGSQMTY